MLMDTTIFLQESTDLWILDSSMLECVMKEYKFRNLKPIFFAVGLPFGDNTQHAAGNVAILKVYFSIIYDTTYTHHTNSWPFLMLEAKPEASGRIWRFLEQ